MGVGAGSKGSKGTGSKGTEWIQLADLPFFLGNVKNSEFGVLPETWVTF